MEKITDLNPYEILGISSAADKLAIKKALAIRQKSNVEQAERQAALNARNLLSITEKRLLVDGFTPDFVGDSKPSQIDIPMSGDNPEIDWLAELDYAKIIDHDIKALIESTIGYNLGEVPVPKRYVELSNKFDGLSDFLDEWLKS